jgi:hypothetical protein
MSTEINNILQGPENTLIICRRDDLLEFVRICTANLQTNKSKDNQSPEVEQPISQREAIKF